MISTLDTEPLQTFSTGSSRLSELIPLYGISLKSAFQLFALVISGLDGVEARVEFGLCISVCNSHSHLLEKLWELVLDETIHDLHYSTVMSEMAKRTLMPVDLDAIILALKGEKVSLDEKVSTFALVSLFCALTLPIDLFQYKVMGCTVRNLITRGAYINKLSESIIPDTIVPHLSEVDLYRFVNRHHRLSHQRTAAPTKEEIYADILHAIMDLDHNFRPLLFESFHAWWEILRRQLLAEPTEPGDTCLSQLYRLMHSMLMTI